MPLIDIVSIQGAPNATLTNGVLALTFADTLTGPSYTPLRHDVAIQEAATETASNLGEIVFGTAGNDVFFAPGSGTNQIHGNGGIDTIMFTAAATNYKVFTNADGSETITDLRVGTPDGIDTIYNIANLIFGGPTISSVAASGTGITNGTGAVATAATVTLTVTFTQAVTVAGAPTLTLNDGGTATYTSGSGSTALTFTYTVLAGQNTSALQVSSVNLPTGATITSALNQNATLTPVPALPGTLQVDTVVPVITGIATSGTGITNGTGSVAPGTVVTLTVTLSDAVKVTGGTPTLTLNNGGTASYTGGTGTTKLTFAYTVASGQATPDLTIASLNLPTGTTIQNAAGTAATLTGATGYNPAGTLVVTTPATLSSISAITTSGTGITAGTGDLNAGKTVTLTATFSQAVTVKGTAPTMTLDDGGTAIYASGSGTTALTFTYVVKAGQNSADLLVESLNLPTGTTITDAKGNNATLTAATNYNPAGTLQIDTTAATLSGVAATGTGITNGAGTVGAGAVVTLTATFSEAVLIGTTKPTLTLNDGGTATYISGSGTNALVFSYTVVAGQNTNDLTITGLTGSALTDGAGNALTMPGAAVNPPGVLKVAAVAPTITITSVAANNTVTLAKAQAGFAITGTSTGIESGQNVTVTIKNSAGTVVDTETVVDNGTTWTANVNSTVAIHLTNDNYTATATATNKAGTAVSATPKAFVVNEGNIPVMPTLTLASNALTVTAGGSIPLGVTATPGNGNDVIPLTIKGLPSYEKIVAPGYTVSSTGSGTSYTWTVTGKAGQTISGESLSLSYTGTGHPVANLTITASSAAAGGQSGKTTAAQTLVMTNPPAASSGTYTITPTSTTVAAASPVTTTPTSMISTAPATTTAKTDLATLFGLGTDGIKLLDSAVPSTDTSTAAYIPLVPTATALSAMGLFQTADAQTLIPTP